MTSKTKAYLGDSVYVDLDDGGWIVLTTENGLPGDPSNTIYLEPEVFKALQDWWLNLAGKRIA